MAQATDGNELLSPVNNRRFLDFVIAQRIHTHPAMLGVEERILPAYAACQAQSLAGSVVELGCYLGGSTLAILEGLARAQPLVAPAMHSFDLFVANDYMVDHSLSFYPQYNIKAGDSFLPLYHDLLGELDGFVAVHPGDMLTQQWQLGPIKYLYVDLLWSWQINQHVFDQFYRQLVPGAWLIHQDYVYSTYPWLPVTMEWLVQQGYFRIESYAQYSTVAFICQKPLADIPADFNIVDQLSYRQKSELIAQTAARFVGYPQALLRLSQAVLASQHGDQEQALGVIEAVEREHQHEFALHHLATVRSLLPGLVPRAPGG